MNRQDRRANSDPRVKERNNRLKKRALREAAMTPKPPEAFTRGIVVALGPGICTAVSHGVEAHYSCDIVVAPGDEVLVENGKVTGITPRRTSRSRMDPSNPNRERIIVANIDLVVIVASLTDPPFRKGLVDRYLAATQRGGAKAVLCVTKNDLGGDLSVADAYRQLGMPVIVCSIETGQGIEELRGLLAGSLSVLVGHSGVGKSSLTNALLDADVAKTGAVDEANRKGRHTTTASKLYQLKNGGRIIDTPGIRAFGLKPMTKDEIEAAFPEFREFECRFRDCSHDHEPECGVKDAVAQGLVNEHRYQSYLRLSMGHGVNDGVEEEA